MIDRYKLAGDAVLALNRLRQNQSKQLQESVNFRTAKKDFAKSVFEEYDSDVFNQKVKIDSIFFKSLCKNIEEKYMEDVSNLLASYMENVQEIYKHINIKPRVYGFNIMTSLNESEENLEKTSSRIINDFINRQYYSLDESERELKYKDTIKPLASDIILNENVNEQIAVEFSTKATILESLLEKISFPMTIKARIEEDLVDVNYGEIFDQDRLRDLWETFQTQTHNLSKIIAATI